MPQDKLPIKDFAAKIKAKYPQYASVADDVLVQKIVAKYPEYEAQVDLAPLKKKEPQPQPSPKPGAPLNAGTPPISPSTSTSTSTSPSGLPLFGAPKAKPKDKIGVQVQQNEEKRRAESFDDVEAVFREAIDAQSAMAPENQPALPMGTAGSQDWQAEMRARNEANLQLAHQKKEALLKQKAPQLYAPVKELVQSGKAREFFDANGNFKTGKAIEYFEGVVKAKGGGSFVRDMLVATLRKEGMNFVDAEAKETVRKATDKGAKAVGQTGLLGKSLASGWYRGLSMLGNHLASKGYDNTLTRYMQGKDYEAEQLAPGQYQWNKDEWLDRATTAAGTSLGASLPTMLPAAAITIGTGGVGGVAVGGSLGFLGERAMNSGGVYDEVLKQTGDPALAREKADEFSRKQAVTLPLYYIDALTKIKLFKPGMANGLPGTNSLARIAAGTVDIAQELPTEYWQGYTEAQAMGYEGSFDDYIRENRDTALDTIASSVGSSVGFSAAGKIYRTLGSKTPAAKKQFYAEVVAKEGPEMANQVIDGQVQAGALSEEEAAQEKEEIAQVAQQVQSLESLGVKGEDAKAYLALSEELQGIEAQIGETSDPTVLSALKLKAQEVEADMRALVGGQGSYVKVTYPGGARQTAVLPLPHFRRLQRDGEADALIQSAESVEVVGDEALNEELQQKKGEIGNAPGAPEGFYENEGSVSPQSPAPPIEGEREVEGGEMQAQELPEQEVVTPKKTFDLDGKQTFFHASSKPRSGRLRTGTAPQFGTGVYFSTSKDKVTDEFGDHVTEAELALEKPVYTNTPEWHAVQRRAIQMADEAYAKRKGLKPEDMDEDLGYHRYDPDNLGELDEIDATHISNAAKELGYDAIIDKGSRTYENEIVVLDESKIIYPEDKPADVSPQSPSSAPMVNGAAERGEMQVPHAASIKQQFREQFSKKGVKEEEIEGAIALMDARANSWASEQEGRTPEQWYDKIAGVKGGAFQSGTQKQFQIVGEKAVLPEEAKANLLSARDMEAGGKDAKTIFLATGWEKGADGKWRYEIPDGGVTDNFSKATRYGNRAEVGEVYEGAILNAHPEVKGYTVEYSEGNGWGGSFNPKAKHITITYPEVRDQLGNVDHKATADNRADVQKAESILLHELQHAVQSLEGFARGASPSEFKVGGRILDDNSAAVQTYRRVAGEAEARNVQTRSGMDSEAKRQTPLSETEDVARDEQILRFDNATMAQEKGGTAKGAVETLEDGRVVIHALTSPDFSTLVHEIAHVFEKDLTDAERRVIEKAGGSEAFARGFERYVRDGKAPNKELQPLFDKFKQWLTNIYKTLKGSPIEKKVSPEVKAIFDRLLTPVSPQSPSPTPTLVESERGETQPQTLKVYRAGKKKGDVTFYSKTEAYAHEYNDFFLNGEAEVAAEDIAFENPMVVDLSDEEFTDINAQKPHITRAKKAGHDVVIFKNADPEGGYAGEEFYAVIKSNQGKKAESPISPSKKESERGALEEGEMQDNGDGTITYKGYRIKRYDLKSGTKYAITGDAEYENSLTREQRREKSALIEELNDAERARDMQAQIAEREKKPVSFRLSTFPKSKWGEGTTARSYIREVEKLLAQGRTIDEATRADYERAKATFGEKEDNISPQSNTSNELKTSSTPSQDTVTPQTPTKGSNEANRTTGSPAPPAEGSKGQEVTVHDFKNPDDLKRLKAQPSQILKFNQGATYGTVYLLVDPEVKNAYAKDKGISVGYNDEKSRGDSPLKDIAKQYRKKDGDVIIDLRTGKSTPKKSGTYEAKARKLAKKLDNMKMPDWFSVKDPNVKKMGLDAESMKKAFKAIIIDTGILLDKGVEAGEALRRGAEAMVAFVEEGYKKIGGKLKPEAAEAIRAGFTRDAAQIFGITGGGTPPADATIEEDDPSNPTRRFSRRVLKDDTILKGVKPGVEAAMEYTRQTNAMSVQEASEVINRVGADDAYDLVVNDKGLKPAVRVVLGQMLIKKYNQMAEEAAAAGDTERENRYLDKTIDVANYVSEKFGTEAGQMIQALSLFERLTPEAQLRAAQKEVKAIGKKKAERRRKDIEEVGKKLQAANEEAVDELTQSPKVKKAVEKTESERVKKAKDKIEAARKKRENLIKKFRGDRGKNLYSTPGLTPEGIEFVGEMALTYLAEGVANVEIIADKILSEMKALSGKTPPEEVVRQVSDIVRERADRLIDKKTAQGLRELEAAINKIVREHYTVSDEKKTALIDKFVAQTGMDKAEAVALAETIQEEFERIATRKKRDILEAERSRLQKIQKDLDRTEGRHPRELQDEIIKFSNLGALDSEEFFDMVAQKLGVGKLTQKEAKEIKALAERIQKAPEGSPRNEATQDLLAYRANLKGSSFMELSQAVWFANILSGWKTHAVNIVSTFINGVGTFGAEAVRDPRSIPVMLYGAARGTRRGFFEAAHTLITGRSPIHIRKVETPSTLERHQFTGKLSFLNWAKYVLRVMAAEDVVGFQGLKEMRATQLAYREARKQGSGSPFSRKTWAIIERELLNTKERSEAAIAQAEGEGFTKGTRRDFVAWKRRVYELMELSRPVQMTDEAYGFAAKGTFNHPPEGLLGALTNLMTVALDLDINGSRPLRYFVPFTRIIANVVNANLDYTPVGFLRAWRGKRGVESLENNSWTAGAYKELSQEERAQLVAKASLGLIFTAALYTLSHVEDDEGEPLIDITGAGTGNFERDEQLRQTGWQPFSVKVGGVWYSYKYTPLIFNLSLIGHINDHEKYKVDDEETFMYKLMLAAFQTGQQVLDGTFLGSTSAVMETLAQDDPKRMAGGFGGTMAKLTTQTVVPNLPIQGAQAVEEILSLNQKDAKNAFTRLQQHIPYARNLMNDKVNALGEPIPTDTYGFISFEEPHPVFDFLINEKKAWVARVNPNTFMVYDEKKGEERLCTPEEYYKFARLRGQKIKAEVENIMQNGAFVTYDENDKEVVTLNEDEARDVKPASQITSKEMKQLVRALSVRATKEAKEELFSPEW